MEEKRVVQLYDTISKGGNFWRVTAIEGDQVTAKRVDSGKQNHHGGRPLKITMDKISDGTFRLCDTPPVTTYNVKEEEAVDENILAQEIDALADLETELNALRERYDDLVLELDEKENKINYLKARLEQEVGYKEGLILAIKVAVGKI